MRVFTIIFILTLIGCSSSSKKQPVTDSEGIKKYISTANSVDKPAAKKEFGDINFIINPITATARATREVGVNAIGTKTWKTALSEASKLEVFQIVISHKDGLDLLNAESDNFRNYEDRIKYFSFDIQNKIKLNVKDKVFPCIMCHFERSYGNIPYLTLNVAFNSIEEDLKYEDRIVSIDDEYFNIGKVNLMVKKEQILAEPKIN